jgi:hypothetical protein
MVEKGNNSLYSSVPMTYSPSPSSEKQMRTWDAGNSSHRIYYAYMLSIVQDCRNMSESKGDRVPRQ